MKTRPAPILVVFFLVAVIAGTAIVLWQRAVFGPAPGPQRFGSKQRADKEQPASILRRGFLVPRPIGRAWEGQPWIPDLTIADLDRDGWKDVIICDGRLNRVSWVRQAEPGVYVEQDIGDTVAGPAHAEVCDLDQDGDLDVLVAAMGIITPSNDRIGAVVVLENDGAQHFTNRILLENTYRVTYVGAADFDGDGDLDLSVGQFGYFEGGVRWLENQGDWTFDVHPLLDLAGAIHTPAGDVDGDGDVEIVSLISQDWEEIYLSENDGHGRFISRVVWGSTNKDYGSSGLALEDIDLDGDLDIACSNGDGFDYATPGARPWHGIQWLENDGRGQFMFHRVGDFSGCYSPLVVDLDGDGDRDIVASSAFNDWSKKEAVSLMCFENKGAGIFLPRVLASVPTHLVVVKGADMDNDGTTELVTGGFNFYPPFDHISRILIWERKR